jgi:hypothetical protein
MSSDQPEMVHVPVEHKGRRGFLPIETNTFDRVSISVYLFVAICLLWMRFIEPEDALGISVIWGALLSILLGVFIVRKG